MRVLCSCTAGAAVSAVRRCNVPFFKVQQSAFTPPKNRSFRRETISITYCIQKLTRHDGDSAKTGHWTHSHRKWVVEDVGTLHIYIYISIECYVEDVGTLYIYIYVYVCMRKTTHEMCIHVYNTVYLFAVVCFYMLYPMLPPCSFVMPKPIPTVTWKRFLKCSSILQKGTHFGKQCGRTSLQHNSLRSSQTLIISPTKFSGWPCLLILLDLPLYTATFSSFA